MEKLQLTLDYLIVTQVILVRPKAETTDQALAAFFKAVHNTQPHIPCLVSVSTGENRSDAHRGFTHGIFLHFDHDPQEAKAHPKYQDLIARARSLCEQVVTFELPFDNAGSREERHKAPAITLVLSHVRRRGVAEI